MKGLLLWIEPSTSYCFSWPLWTNRHDGPANGDDQASAITMDGAGNVFVTGYSQNGTEHDYATIK